MAASESTLSFELFIDAKEKKVLFAEAEKDVVDFLFGILTLPVGAVIRLLKTEGMAGVLGNLYNSVEGLNDKYMLGNNSKATPPHFMRYPASNSKDNSKDTLLKPKVAIPTAIVPLLLSNVVNDLFRCPHCRVYVSDDSKAICPRCCRFIDERANDFPSQVEGGFVNVTGKYMIMDDLAVKPMSTELILDLLNKSVEVKEINLSMDEGLKILRASFMTQTVLTQVFLMM